MRKYQKQFEANQKTVCSYYNYLVELTSNHYYIGTLNEWIADNYYLIAEQEKAMRLILANRKGYNYAFKGEVDLYEVLYKILKHNKFKVDKNTLIKELNLYQDNFNYAFTYYEINAIASVTYLVLLSELAKLCMRAKERLTEELEVKKLLNHIQVDISKKHEVNLHDYINIDDDIFNKPVYLERLNAGLKELGQLANDVFKQLNNLLEKKNINLNTLIESVYQKQAEESILTSNIFNSIIKTEKIPIETLYRKISKTEYVLKLDPYYSNMTTETKVYYRSRVLALAKKKKMKEYDLAKKLIAESTKEGKHIGFYLQKEVHQTRRVVIYLGIVSFLTLLFSFFLSKYFLPIRFLGMLILIVPVSEVVIEILNRIYLKIYPPIPLPKLDFNDGIPKSCATMTVIVTILDNVQKVGKMFDKLESFYLANKSDNLYFTLLGDCKASQNETEAYDEDVLRALKDRSEILNRKYGKEIFYYAYRKRTYNPSEGEWLGYERKRGALEQFNSLLLGNLPKEDEEKYYLGHSFKDFNKKIKYVITLDQDTQLVLGAAYYMVGAMAHPLNKPVFNQDHTKIVKGYGIMQPRVSVDVESTNKSFYTQVYAGLGGYDIYNKVIPNFYQDVFDEGSFWGKGIYDLEVFDATLSGLFPTNRILSHDLLEGNYVRCGFLSDIEVIDDFPSSFLADAKRRHRWARGDMQIASWIISRHSPLNLLERYKIFDNLRRGTLDLSLLLILILAFTVGIVNPALWLFFVTFVLLLPILFYINDKVKTQKERTLKIKHYQNIAYGFKAVVIRTLSTFSALPYNAKLYTDAFFRAWWRLHVSHKHLLAWVTSDDASKNTNNLFFNFFTSFIVNYAFSFIFILLSYLFKREYLSLAIATSLIFFVSSVIFYLISKETEDDKRLTSLENEKLRSIAKDTWHFFDKFIAPETNYLIFDNYQLNREFKEDIKTSPTNIGFSLLAIISAYELDFISSDEATDRIGKIITTIEKLEKWHGHLYNWYNVSTLKKMYPSTVSTVDSGNFIASLMVTESFVKRYGNANLRNRIENLIQQTNFKYLYNKDEGVFSCGYDTFNEQLITYNYNKFASESRLTSFVAIAKGDIKKEHWFLLDKTLTTYQGRKGLLSWTGSMFEYYMPLIWLRTYPNTLMDESYYFAHHCQKEYMRMFDTRLPWGVSEAAYNLLDNSQNYKYKAFGVPHLRFHDNHEERLVLSPYSSILSLPLFPKDVYINLKKYQKLNMYGEYGFLESYDYSDETPVFSYFAHHQGMILASLTNYLAGNAIQNYFYDDIRVQAIDVLNKEKVQIEPMIDLKIARLKKYDYDKEIIENDIREYDHLSMRPEVSVLSNARYSVLLNDRGGGFSRYKTIQLNRYRKITEQDYGNFLYIRDLKTNKVWSNTYSPTNIKPDRYHVVFALDRIRYMRVDGEIVTDTEIIVTKRHNAEIRKITFKNVGVSPKQIELTSYTEPILSENEADISHRVFNNMFIKSLFDEDTKSLVLYRRLRGTNDKYYMMSKLFIDEPLTNYTYDTERSHFVDKMGGYQCPMGLFKPLTNYAGENLDPISSIRNIIDLPPMKDVTIYMITGFGRSLEQVLAIASSYATELAIEEAFELATITTNNDVKKLGVRGADVHLYNKMLNYLYQTSRINLSDHRKKLLMNNNLGQDTLWKFGISGERPIILVEMSDISSASFVYEVLKAFEYYKSKSIFADLVIINSYEEKTAKMISKLVDDELYRIYTVNNFANTPGRVVLINYDKLTPEELNLFRSIARLSFNTIYNNSLREQIDLLQKENQINDYHEREYLISDSIPDDNLLFNNEYGGFTTDGREYHITNPNTPMPWSNVLTNGQFGTIITNNNNGFTYAYNSHEYKITSWTNDTILDDKSEGITINDKYLKWRNAIHGIGYSKFKFKNADYRIDGTYFVPMDANVKVAYFTLTNLSGIVQELDIRYWINPVLGGTEEKTARHLVCNYYELNKFLTIQNKYAMNYKDAIVYMGSSEDTYASEVDNVLWKSISIKKVVNPDETITFAFLLGVENSLDDVQNVISKYEDKTYLQNKYQETITYWQKRVNKVTVKTTDEAFNFMVNNWYLYQTLASRIMAKAGFYQVGGAFGFRDQLQDAMNICLVEPNLTRDQILLCARHQFKEGDVLHWWHMDNHFGLRSRYKDDYLWLIYATSEYIDITGDSDILKEEVPFVLGDTLSPDEEERGMTFNYSEDTKPLYDHLKIIMDKLFNELGENGLPLMGGGDWNDGMNLVGINGKGTSVWLGFFAYDVVRRFIKIASSFAEDTKKYEEFNTHLKESLLNNAWDGKYYLRAFFDNGDKLGSSTNDECKVDLISQSWSIITGIATSEQLPSIISAVSDNLVDVENKLIKLLTPPFKNTKNNPGYIKSYAMGIRENGGQYTHSVAWWIMALLELGLNDQAYNYFQMVNPINHTLTKNDVLKYQVEPYVIAADIYSNPEFIGHGGWTWYTGSSGWFYKVAIMKILGLVKNGDKLFIKPHLPKTMNGYEMEYHYQDTTYQIKVVVSDNDAIYLDGNPTSEISLENDNQTHTIICHIKKDA